MDFIFGTYATDALKLVHHRAHALGLQHRGALDPRDPRPGQPVRVTVWSGADWEPEQIACYYTTDGCEPRGSRGTAQQGSVVTFSRAAVEWDTLSWGYLSRWEAVLPPQAAGVFVRYRIGGWGEGQAEIFADYPDAMRVSEFSSHAFFHHQATEPDYTLGDPMGSTFVYHVDDVSTPAWAKDAVIYHLMVDRFSPGDGRDWLQTSDLGTFCGGTLDGVRDKLGYLQDLGVNCLWLSPTFAMHSYHGYDTIDYRRTDDRFGGDAAMHALIDAAHRRGMRVLFDMACNHLSDVSALFQTALHHPDRPERAWFTFDDSPLGYRAFFNVASMPQVNLTHDAARDWMVENGRFWLREFEVDGFRLDYANGPGPAFWSYFNAGCKDVRPDCYCFGEVVDSPGAQQQYIGRLDGCLDFFSSEILRKTYGWKTLAEADMRRILAQHHAFLPSDFVMPAFLDNHDMDRFLYVAQGDKDALRRAFAQLARLPNPPVIYYGTEVGLTHAMSTREHGLEVGRVPMVWDSRQDRELLTFFADTIRARAAAGKGDGR